MSRVARRRPRIIATVWCWVVVLLAVVVISELGNDRHWLGTILASIPGQLWFLPTILLGLLALAGRNFRRVWVPAGLAVLLHLRMMGWTWTLMVGTTTPTIRVMNWNIKHGEMGMEKVVAMIRKQNPDVLLLQETHSVGVTEPLVVLKRELTDYHFVGDDESIVASRLPVRGEKVNILPDSTHRRYVPVADVEYKGHVIQFASLHLLNGVKPSWLLEPNRLRQRLDDAETTRKTHFRHVLDVLPTSGPLVVGGDFNTMPKGGIYARLRERFGDAFARAGRGCGLTFPDLVPTVRIDHQFYTDELLPVRAESMPSDASDHACVVVDYIFRS